MSETEGALDRAMDEVVMAREYLVTAACAAAQRDSQRDSDLHDAVRDYNRALDCLLTARLMRSGAGDAARRVGDVDRRRH